MRVFISVLFILTGLEAISQSKFTLNGYVKDTTSGELVIGATIAINGKSVSSNQHGFYSVTMEPGEYDVLVSHVSFLTQSFHIILQKNIEHTIFLFPRSAEMNEVVVY